jgi:hypothetical protein
VPEPRPRRPFWISTAVAALAAGGLAWLAGAAATGSRYPGLSLAWLLPAALALGAASLVLGAAAGVARWARLDPLTETARCGAPMWLGWVAGAALLASPEANHYFANWVRLRTAALLAVCVLVAAVCGLLLLRAVERRRGTLTRLTQRAGVPALVFGGSLAVLLASGGGHLYTPDEWTIYGAAAGLVGHGVPAAYADEPYPLHLLGGLAPAAERAAAASAGTGLRRVYPKYGILPSLLAAPVYGLARLTGPGADLPDGPFPYENRALPLVPLLVNPLLTAATAALLYVVARDLRYGRRAALVAVFAYLFGSLAWPYSKTLLSMTPAGLGLLASFWCAVRARGAGGEATRWVGGSGLCAGLAAAARYEALLFALPVAVWCVLGEPGLARRLRRLALFGAGAAVAALPLVLGMNALRTGNPLDAGYGGEGTLASLLTKPWYGWFGILLSPGCGLVPHAPLMAVGLLALAWLWEDDPAPALVAGAATLGSVLYYGSLSTTWCAFATWGPRYFVALAPLMALPLAAVWARLPGGGRNPFVLLIGGGLFLWSAGANLLAVLIDFNRGWQDHWALGVTYLETSWIPFFSGITAHVRLLRAWLLDGQGGLDLYLLYAPGPAGPWLLAALSAAGGAAFATAWITAAPGSTGSRPGLAVAGLDQQVDVAHQQVDDQAEEGHPDQAVQQPDDDPHRQQPPPGQAALHHQVAAGHLQDAGDQAEDEGDEQPGPGGHPGGAAEQQQRAEHGAEDQQGEHAQRAQDAEDDGHPRRPADVGAEQRFGRLR